MNRGGGWNALFWCNHDQPRVVTRYGNDDVYHEESAKMLATTIHMMQGTPYIYQGEEFGMTDPGFESISEYRDVETLNYYKIMKEKGLEEEEIMAIIKRKSRDNSRTPVQWNDSENAGFTTGTPWIGVADNYKEINAEAAVNNSDSIFYHYQKLIQLRKDLDLLTVGDYRLLLEDDQQFFVYERNHGDEKLLVINNFYGKEGVLTLPEEWKNRCDQSELILSNYKDEGKLAPEMTLRPYESLVYYVR